MNRIEKISRLANDTLVETNLKLKDKSKIALKKDIDRLLKLISSKNFKSLESFPNIEVFSIFANILYDEDSTYEEIAEDTEKVKSAVNRWTYESSKNDIKLLFEHTNYGGIIDDNKYLENFYNLNLTQEFLEYPMKFVYKAMLAFLKLKSSLKEASSRSNTMPKQEPILLMNKLDFSPKIRTRIKTPQEIYETSEFRGFVRVLEEHMEKEMKEYDAWQSALRKRKTAYEELISSLSSPDFINITSIPDKWHQYLEPRTLEEIYYLIQDNLFKEKKALTDEEKDLESVINRSELTRYLYSNNINPNYFDSEVINKLEKIPNISNRIDVLTKLGISIIDIVTQYYDLLSYLSDDKIKQLQFLLKSKAISTERLRANIYHILDEKYAELITNYEILKNIIDFESIFYNDEIMFINPRELKNRLKVLAEYKLTKNNFIFLLCNFQFITIYDLIIEQEIPNHLFITICKTKNPLNTIKRIMLYKLIGEDYLTPNHHLRKELLSEEKFVCQDDDLDQYIINVVPQIVSPSINGNTLSSTNNLVIKELDENYRLDDLYIIGGVNISRPKFIRNFEARKHNLDYLVQSLLSNSILDESSVYSIYNELEIKKLKK